MRKTVPLNIYLNRWLVGVLVKERSGAIAFSYDESWLNHPQAIPVSLSLPLSIKTYRGEKVAAVFDNLLPDNEEVLRRIAEREGAASTKAYDLLEKIGRDCVGALQFIPVDEEPQWSAELQGDRLNEAEIEEILLNLKPAPLGMSDSEFRISLAGAQEKTALLHFRGEWYRPKGTTPTTHILKPQLGQIQMPKGMVDFSHSVENEHYCLELLRLFDTKVNDTQIMNFGSKRVLVVERFDRRFVGDQRLIRLPQEDCCQALSYPPTRKYQSADGPSAVDILKLLKAADEPANNQRAFLKSLMIFWLIGANDGHAKNFSIFLLPHGRFRLTPFYDVLSSQPCLDRGELKRNEFKMAMGLGNNNKYDFDYIQGRHFIETCKLADIGEVLAREVIEEVGDLLSDIFEKLHARLPKDFPTEIGESIQRAAMGRRDRLHLL